MLKIEGLRKSFGHTQVLKGVDLELFKGEILVIVGPSGGGKTTLLRCINYLEKCSSGTISIDGKYLLHDGVYASKNELMK
ncbi:MAG: Phosphonate-transporting ATPase, partial [Clostridia bacterium]|nr:Phosphonate-transporting ATPase [Clostridia bacterium]